MAARFQPKQWGQKKLTGNVHSDVSRLVFFIVCWIGGCSRYPVFLPDPSTTSRRARAVYRTNNKKEGLEMCQDCIVLDERLRKLSFELYQVKKANTNLRGELQYERREKQKLIKEKKEKQHYRNGQKRGRTRNG